MGKKHIYNKPYPLIIGLVLTVLGIIVINSALQTNTNSENGTQTLTVLMFFGVGLVIAGMLRFRYILQPNDSQPGIKDKLFAFFLWLGAFFGLAGLHRFYLGKIGTGILWFFTFGLLGIGQLIDLFRLSGMVDAHNREVSSQPGQQDLAAIRAYLASKEQQPAPQQNQQTLYTCTHCRTAYQTHQMRCSNCGAPLSANH